MEMEVVHVSMGRACQAYPDAEADILFVATTELLIYHVTVLVLCVKISL